MSNPFRYFNSSPEIIRLVVMMYVRYPLSLRNVEDLLDERGIDISHETVRFWWNRFGPMFAAEIRKRRVVQMRGRWHLDEVFVKINGKLCYLWRAVDHEGEVLEAVVTARRDKAATLQLLKRIMRKYGAARSIVTDGLRAYSAAMNEVGVAAERHEVGGRLNIRAENSHQPFRRRERAMQRFRSLKTLQKFSSVHAQAHNQFNQERHLVTQASLQAETLCCLGRVARSRIDHRSRDGDRAACRRASVTLTPPQREDQLVKLGLVREVRAKAGMPVWRRDETGQNYTLKLTAAGLRPIAIDDGSEKAFAPREAPQPRPNPDATKASGPDVIGERAKTLAPRGGSKLARAIDLLQRSEGATIPNLIEATRWLPHTTRAALTGLRRRGYAVVRERIDGEIHSIVSQALQPMTEVALGSSSALPVAPT